MKVGRLTEVHQRNCNRITMVRVSRSELGTGKALVLETDWQRLAPVRSENMCCAVAGLPGAPPGMHTSHDADGHPALAACAGASGSAERRLVPLRERRHPRGPPPPLDLLTADCWRDLPSSA